MGVAGGPDIIENGLVLDLDASDRNSYVSGSTTWFDLSGNNNSGSLVNGPTFNTGSLGSIVFDGTNDYVDLGKPASLNFGSNSFSLSLYFFVSTGNRLQVLLNKGSVSNSNSSGWYLNLENRYNSNLNGLAFTVNSTSVNTSFAQVTTTSSYVANRWNNLTAVWDSVAKNSLIYLNSTLMTTTVTQTQGSGLAGVTNTDNSNYNNIIGAYDNGASFFYNGNIASVQMYNKALSSDEILQNYNATKARFGL